MFVAFLIDVLCSICLFNVLDVQAILARQKSSTPSDPIKSCDESYRKAITKARTSQHSPTLYRKVYHHVAPRQGP